VRTAAAVVAAAAERVLSVYTHRLEREVYAWPPFVDAVKHLVLSRRFAKVRVLVCDVRHLHPTRDPLLVLAGKLTAHVELREVVAPHGDDPATYVIADRHAILYRLQHDRWEGLCDLHDRAIAATYLDAFDAAWIASAVPRTPLAIHA
jgi:hypothetical protein